MFLFFYLDFFYYTHLFCYFIYSKTTSLYQTGQMIELRSEYLSVWYIWLYALVMSHMCFSVNPHSIVNWMSRNFLFKAGAKLLLKAGAKRSKQARNSLTFRQLQGVDSLWNVYVTRLTVKCTVQISTQNAAHFMN